MEEFITHIISNAGIPAAVCFYTLFGVNKTLEKQNSTLEQLTSAINKLTLDVKKIETLENQVHELAFKVDKLQDELSCKIAHMQWKE